MAEQFFHGKQKERLRDERLSTRNYQRVHLFYFFPHCFTIFPFHREHEEHARNNNRSNLLKNYHLEELSFS